MNMVQRHTRLPVYGTLLLAAWGSTPLAWPQDHGAKPETTAEAKAPTALPPEFAGLPQRWETAMEQLGVPGLAVTVVRGNEVIYTAAFGERDPQRHLPVTPDTIFYIASCTKSFVAMAMLSLVEEGKVDLDAPVKRYLPRFALSDPSLTQTLTIRELLSHAKGINSQPIVFLDAFTGEITEDRFYEWLPAATIRGSFAYSNLHYTLAGRVLEAVERKPWKDVLTERILTPAGMNRTTPYAGRMYGDPNAAVPCVLRNNQPVPATVRKFDETMHAAGGLGASINDLSKWLILNLNGGRVGDRNVLPEKWIQEMQRMQSKMGKPEETLPGNGREGYGLGWSIGSYKEVPRIEHGGGYTGASAYISFMPQHKIGVAVVANAGLPLPLVVAGDVYDRLVRLDGADLVPELVQRAKRRMEQQQERITHYEQHPLTQDALSLPITDYVGAYQHPAWGTVVVEQLGDRLTARVGSLPLMLSPEGENRFVVLVGEDQQEQGRFETSADGVTAIVIAFALGDTDVRFERAR